MRPTMKDVAQAAGVSLMTVSRVVSGGSGVAPETVARVENEIRRLGYQRDDIARNLRSKDRDSRTVGLVVDDLANPFFSALARSVEDEAHRHGCVVLVGSTNDDPRRERDLISAFCSRRVDGLIVVPTGGNRTLLRTQMSRGVKVVCVDRPAPAIDADCVMVDNHDGAERAVSHLLDHGHRRIAYLGDRKEIWTQGQRFEGYLAALGARGVEPDPALVRHGLRSRADSIDAVEAMMKGDGAPTAIFSGNDLVTLGVVDGIAGRGVALVGFDDFPLSDHLDPPVTVVSQDPAALGLTAAQLLFSRIDGDDSPTRSVVLLTRFVVRGSGESPPPA